MICKITSGRMKSSPAISVEDRPKNITHKCEKLGNHMWPFYRLVIVCIFCYHTSLLYLQWRDEEVSTSINPSGIPFIQPDIVICPRRFICKAIANNPPLDRNDYLTPITKRILNSIVKLDKWYRNNSIKSPVFIWDTLDMGDLYRVFYPYPGELLLTLLCNFKEIDRTGLMLEANMIHFACYRITPEMCKLTSPTNSLEIKFYNHLHGANKTVGKHNVSIHGRPIYSYMFSALEYDDEVEDGIVVYFVQPKELIHRGTRGVDLNPKTHTTIRITSSMHTRISTSKNKCKSEDPDSKIYSLFSKHGSPDYYTYSNSSLCAYGGIQVGLHRSMNCVSSQFPIPADIPENYTYCGDISSRQVHERIGNYTRFLKELTLSDDHIVRKCLNMAPCTTIKHASSFVTSTWPQKYAFKHLFENHGLVMENRSGASETPGLDDMYYDVKKNPNNIPLWEMNLLKVTIAPGELNSTVVMEYRPYSLKNFFCDAGGIMGFYMGASLLTLGEVFRLVHYIIARTAQKLRTTPEEEPISLGNDLTSPV